MNRFINKLNAGLLACLCFFLSPAVLANPSCSQLSDHFCKEVLWNSKNNGNLRQGSSQFYFGPSTRRDVSQVQILILQNIFNHKKQLLNYLPKSFQAKSVDLFNDLAKILREFNDKKVSDSQWEKELALWNTRLGFLKEEIIYEKLYEKYPRTRHLSNEDWSMDEKVFFNEKILDLNSRVIYILYHDHPNWLKVKKVFSQAKAHLKSVLLGLNLADELKNEMIGHLTTVSLSLPYGDQRRMIGCSSSEYNAFYHHIYHKITVCPALFLAMDSEPALYLLLSHELAHSFDPGALVRFQMSKDPFFLNSLRLVNNPQMSCMEWDKLKEEIFSPLPQLVQPALPLEKLTSCLVDRSTLKSWEEPLLRQQSEMGARGYMSYLSQHNYFSTLVSPSYRRQDGQMIENPFYLNPDALYRQKEGYVRPPIKLEASPYLYPVAEIFALEYRCQSKPADSGSLALASEQEFMLYLDKVFQYIAKRQIKEYSYYGNESPALQSAGFAKSSVENFADWMAYQTLPLVLEQLPSLDERRAYSAEMGAFFCEKPSPLDDIQHLVVAEDRYNLDPHATDRGRRINAFTEQVSRLVECQPEPEVIAGFAGCKL